MSCARVFQSRSIKTLQCVSSVAEIDRWPADQIRSLSPPPPSCVIYDSLAVGVSKYWRGNNNKKKKASRREKWGGRDSNNNVIIELCPSLVPANNNDMMMMTMKNLYTQTTRNNNKLYLLFVRIIYNNIFIFFFLGQKIGLFYCVRVISARRRRRWRGGGPIIPWISGVCTWRVSVFCAKKHFPARRVRKFDNTVFFSSVLSSAYCIIVIIYIYRAVREKKNLS